MMTVHAAGQTIAVPRPALSSTELSMPRSKGIVVGFWAVTALFCLQIGFTAYAHGRRQHPGARARRSHSRVVSRQQLGVRGAGIRRLAGWTRGRQPAASG
jgi:hypothetical protein